jgi:hypothetical protein
VSAPPSLASAVRFSVTGLVESLHAFLAWNLVLLVAVALVLLALTITNLALLAVPFLAPLVCGLLRLATVSHRGDQVALRTALPGIRRRLWTKIGLASVHAALLLLAALNLLVAPAIGGLVGALSMAMSVYLAAALLAYAVIAWTLLCDPWRETRPVRHLLRLAIIVLLRRPLQVLFLVLVLALAVAVTANLVVPGFFLPSMVLLLFTGYVIPAADELAEQG